MKEIPILFSTPMVQALPTGRKTKTRRLSGFEEINKWPGRYVFDTLYYDEKAMYARFYDTNSSRTTFFDIKCPWGRPGDMLWVKEEHYRFGVWIEDEGVFTKTGKQKMKFIPTTDEVKYNDDAPEHMGVSPKRVRCPVWYKRLGRFMHKSSARIWLEVTDIKVERLQDISSDDALAEGIEVGDHLGLTTYPDYAGTTRRGFFLKDSQYSYPEGKNPQSAEVASFCTLWHSINGRESWNANPWVWVISFKVLSTTGKP
jgi:hypothetical protein